MDKHQEIINKFSEKLKENKDNLALFLTGSVARNEANETSDLDLLLVTNNSKDFQEKEIDGIVVEIKSNTLDGFIKKMDEKPMNIYQWLDAKIIFGDKEILNKLQKHAQKIMSSYESPEFLRKWLESVRIKILAAKENGDNLNLGFQTSNILWKIVEGFYILNKEPLPPATTAFRRISTLKNLPDDFINLWNKTLKGDLEERSDATLELLNFLLR